MSLDEMIITVFCLIDDQLKLLLGSSRVRQRGPETTLSDSEVLTMEVVGEYLGYDKDNAMFAYFQHHWSHFFPQVCRIDRTTFTRQASNLSQWKERLWQHLLKLIPYDPRIALLDTYAAPVCQFGRAPRCKRFRNLASYGKDHATKQTIYGFHFHWRVCWPGVITAFAIAPANRMEIDLIEDLTEGMTGFVIGDRAYWHPAVRDELKRQGIDLLAPFRQRSLDPHPQVSHALNRKRWRIETVLSQLVVRYHGKKLWARDLWHLGNRLLRKVLSHTIAYLLNCQRNNHPLRFAQLMR